MDKVLRAIHDVVHRHPGGGTEIAKTMGCYHYNTINNKADPYEQTHQMNVSDIIAITNITGDNEIIQAMAYEAGLGVYPLRFDESKQETLLRLITGLGKKRGEVDKALHDALDDDCITEKERLEIHRQATHAITALLQLLAHIDDKTVADSEARTASMQAALKVANRAG